MPVAKGQKGVAQEMRKFKKGKLHSGSKKGPIVTDRKQAMAIAMRSAGMPKPGSGKVRKAGPAMRKVHS